MEELEKITIMDHLVQVGHAIIIKYEGMNPNVFLSRNLL